MSYQGPPSWQVPPPNGWPQQQPWQGQYPQPYPQRPPPNPPNNANAKALAIVITFLAGACCLYGRSKNERAPAVTEQPASTAPAAAPVAVPPPPPAVPSANDPPSVAELMSTVNLSDPVVARSYPPDLSVHQGRNVMAAWAMMGGTRCGRGAEVGGVSGRMMERVLYVTPQCSPRWLARFLNCRMVYSDDRRPVHTPLYAAGFRVAECSRSPGEAAGAVYAVTP